MTTIIVPAHNEARVIGRLLSQLMAEAQPGEFNIVVVANGCTDDTAKAAASFGPAVRVISIPVASKSKALAAGNQAVDDFPRIYVDADVELHTRDVRALAEALRQPGVLGVGPRVTNNLADRPWLIRWYYAVWEQLPAVQAGLFGRGVIGVSETGYKRIADLPPAGGRLGGLTRIRTRRARDRARCARNSSPAADLSRPTACTSTRCDGRERDRAHRWCPQRIRADVTYGSARVDGPQSTPCTQDGTVSFRCPPRTICRIPHGGERRLFDMAARQ